MHVAIIEPLGVPEHVVQDLMRQIDNCTYSYATERTTDEDELVRRAQDAEVVIVANAPLPASVLERCPNLRMISVAFTGLDHIDLEWCKANGVMVCNCAGYSTEAVAEEAFGLMLSLYRHLITCDALVRTGKTREGLVFSELRGKTLGVVGNGSIAQRVLELGKAFGMRLLCHARTERPLKDVQYVSLEELCAQSDVVSLHVPAVPETYHMIGAAQLELMKPTAILINTARGTVVDNEALAVALERRTIAGAGLDVFDDQPPLARDLPILLAPHTVLAPHIGFATQEALDTRARMAIANVNDFLRHHWLTICATRG